MILNSRCCFAHIREDLRGGIIENAHAIAAHQSSPNTKLYDRTGDEITLDKVDRIAI
jgi:hypothetical protein